MLSYCITKSQSHLPLRWLKGFDCALGLTGVLTEPTPPLQKQSKTDGLVMQLSTVCTEKGNLEKGGGKKVH